jgi:hypothetical protein
MRLRRVFGVMESFLMNVVVSKNFHGARKGRVVSNRVVIEYTFFREACKIKILLRCWAFHAEAESFAEARRQVASFG